ncbi:ABC transporter permease [Saccharothrix violaceirubra]|uniref:Transport permease protein n=1 Tax=Saccharothrix violaceirubra TaxID=413306 RepID=A0A7W7T728_9PSEU|nr:ABC transporter permease [Saccharothrix violaceirubra]MBB4967750.1 ABC-2 type transport system permease protein [Saccharothrix violaceirubra]
MLRDTLIVYRVELAAAVRSRVAVAIGLVQPVLYLVLFGPLLTDALPGERAMTFFVPGLFVQLGLFATGYAGFSLIPDLRSGVLERLRVTPVSRAALLLGRVLRDATTLAVQGTALVLCGLAFGLRASWWGVPAGLALVVVAGVGLASLSYAAAVKLPGEYLFAPVVNSVAVPVMLLSGVLLPMSFAPGWLDAASRLNPLRYVVDGVRALFDGRLVVVDAAVGVAFAVACVAVALRTFRF